MRGLSLFAAVAALSSSAFAEQAVKIEITVSKDRIISLAGQSVTLDELAKRLAVLAKTEKVSEVIVDAADGCPLDAITVVLDACRRNGLNKIRIRSR